MSSAKKEAKMMPSRFECPTSVLAPADLLLLDSGKTLLTYGRRVVPCGVRGMLSHDEGETWDSEHKITLPADSADNATGHPSSVQLDDGTICTAFYVCESLAYGTWGRLGPSAWLIRYREEDILPLPASNTTGGAR